MSDISLSLDQDNELRFNVSIEGSKPGSPKYRLVFENRSFSYAFNGVQSGPGEVSFQVPSMKNMLKEGTYRGNLEVMVDDRYFVPLTFDASFEESIKVTAESVVRPQKKSIGVSASIVTAATPARKIVESAPVEWVQNTVNQKPRTQESVGEFNGKKITAEDLRRIIRSGGL